MVENKIKILLITARADYGGGPEHVFRLLDGLQNEFDFFIACPYEEPYINKYQKIISKEKILRIPHRKFTIADLHRIKYFILKNGIQIIHSHGKGAGIYSRIISGLIKIKCIHTFHGVHLNQYNVVSKTSYKLIERFLSRSTDAFVSVSQSEYESVLKNKFADKNKLHIIENGVVIPELPTNENVFYTKPLLVTSITRFDYAKNSSLIINILEYLAKTNSLDRFKFIFIGSGPEETLVKNKLKEKKFSDYVEFTGNMPRPEDILKKTFCYISTSRWEGLPLGMLEAMAIGIPCIATDVSGNRDLVIDQVNGFLFNLTEPQMAAKYLIEISNDINLWRKFSINARNLVTKKYSLNFMLEKTKNLYENISRN